MRRKLANKRFLKLFLAVLWVQITIFQLQPVQVLADTVLIDFEYFPGDDGIMGTVDDIKTHKFDPISDQFSCMGALFSLIDGEEEPAFPMINETYTYIPTSPGVLYPVSPDADFSKGEANMKDVRIDFTTPVSSVKIKSLDSEERVTLEAYNSDDILIASYPQCCLGNYGIGDMSVQVDGSSGYISYVIVDLSQTSRTCCGGGPEFYDILEYETVYPVTGPLCETVVPVDIKPSSCPNPVNVNSKGVLPVAILGTDELNVSEIDATTIQLEGVSPLRYDYEDVTTPFEPYEGKLNVSDCNAVQYPDGNTDLTLKFDTKEVLTAVKTSLGRELKDGEILTLNLSGELSGDTKIKGEDVIIIKSKGKK